MYCRTISKHKPTGITAIDFVVRNTVRIENKLIQFSSVNRNKKIGIKNALKTKYIFL